MKPVSENAQIRFRINRRFASNNDGSSNIPAVAFALWSWSYLWNVHFVLENCKSFVIVLLQSQILWQWKNAVGVIKLEKLFVHEPPHRTPLCRRCINASLKMAQLFFSTALFSVTQALTGTKMWFPGFVDLLRDEFALCSQRNSACRTKAGNVDRLFSLLLTKLCMKKGKKIHICITYAGKVVVFSL